MSETDWIEVAKTGTFTGSNGTIVTLAPEDLDAIVQNYNPAVQEAPLVFGHPQTDHPAYGWVTQLQRIGNTLLAKFKQVPEAVKELVRAGHFKKISLGLMPDKRTIRHVGLLGAVQPAIPGMKNVEFSSGESFYCEEASSYSMQDFSDAYHGTRRVELAHSDADHINLTHKV